MKGWVGHGHPEHLVEHQGVRGIQGPGPEQAGGALGARKDSRSDVPRRAGTHDSWCQVSLGPGLRPEATRLLQTPQETTEDKSLSFPQSLCVQSHLPSIVPAFGPAFLLPTCHTPGAGWVQTTETSSYCCPRGLQSSTGGAWRQMSSMKHKPVCTRQRG